MERRRLVAKLLMKHSITDFPKYRRAADAPSVTGFAKVSGCLCCAMLQRQPETHPAFESKQKAPDSKVLFLHLTKMLHT